MIKIDKKYLVSLAQKLVQADSSNPPGKEKAIVDILAKELKGFCKIKCIEMAKDRPNLLAIFGSGDKKLIIHGHTDTVPAGPGWKFPPFSAKIINGKLYGRGATDMKGTLAAIVAAFRSLKQSKWKPKGQLIFLACCNEEMGDGEEIGMRYMAKKIKGGLVLLTDTTDFNITSAEKGALWLEFISKGKEAHGATPWKGVNAIEKLAKFISELNKLFLPGAHHILGRSTISVNMISGGMKTNVIPAFCKARADIRIVPKEKKEDVIKALQGLIDQLKKEDKDLNIKIKELLYLAPVEIDTTKPYVSTFVSCAQEVLGKPIQFVGEHGATGAGVFIKVGNPTLVFGPGKPELCHVKDEYIEINDLVKAAQIYAEFAKKFLS